MKETYAYHGHSIDLNLSDIARDRIQWTYFIDGNYCVQGATDACSRARVRLDAVALAHHSIDALDAMQSETGNALARPEIDPGPVTAQADRR